MKILIVTPLFPPDTATSAQYTKELTVRLSAEHEVTTLLYGHLPEQAGTATLVSVDKNCTPPVRTWRLMQQLPELARAHDLILIQNGPSVELACILALRFAKARVVLMESDQPALTRTLRNPFLNAIHDLLAREADCVFGIKEIWPIDKPIIHPLQPKPTAELAAWETSWQEHLDALFTKCIPS